MSFTESWFGSHSRRNLCWLADQTSHLNGAVIEVGCWEGRSTVALANAVHPTIVHAVDTWTGSPGEISEELASERDVFATWARNVEELTAGNVTPHRMGWREFFADWDAPIRFLFIDAAHTMVEVKENIEAAVFHMVSDGIICGDDAHHPPVWAGVNAALGPDVKTGATLWFWRMP